MERNPNESGSRVHVRNGGESGYQLKNIRSIEKPRLENKTGFGESAQVHLATENGEDRGFLVFRNGYWEVSGRIELPTLDAFYTEAVKAAQEKYPNG